MQSWLDSNSFWFPSWLWTSANLDFCVLEKICSAIKPSSPPFSRFTSFYVYGCFFACVCVCHMHAVCLWRPEEGIGFPGNVATDHCELQCRCWELNMGPQRKKSVPLTAALSLQPSLFFNVVLTYNCTWHFFFNRTVSIAVNISYAYPYTCKHTQANTHIYTHS